MIIFFSYVFVPLTNIVIQAHIDEHHTEQLSHSTVSDHAHNLLHFYHDEDHAEHPEHHHELVELESIEEGLTQCLDIELSAQTLVVSISTSFFKSQLLKKKISFSSHHFYNPPPDKFRNLPLLN